MKKRILVNLLQYIGAFALLICTVLFIYAFEAGKLPFMDSDYLDAREEAALNASPEVEQGGDASQQPPVQETAATYIGKLPKADKDVVPYEGLFGSDSKIAVRSLSGLNLSAATRLDICMGYVIANDNGKVSAVYDNVLNDVSAVLNGYSLTFKRDALGRPLLYGADGHVYLDNGALLPADYDKYNLDKGLNCEYPSYLSGYNAEYSVFEEGGMFGLRKVADGTVIIPAKYVDVYGVSEGRSIAVDKDNRLYMFDTNGKLISNSYYATEDDGASAIGYFFVRKGLTRARSSSGEEIILRADGSVFQIPSGFSVLAYSDGAILLKGQKGYGYMLYNGKWLCSPDYEMAQPFNEGLAVVCDKSGLYGMIDLSGATVVPHLFNSLSNSSDGVVVAYTQKFGYYILNKIAA